MLREKMKRLQMTSLLLLVLSMLVFAVVLVVTHIPNAGYHIFPYVLFGGFGLNLCGFLAGVVALLTGSGSPG